MKKPKTKKVLAYNIGGKRAKNFDDGIRPGRVVAVADYIPRMSKANKTIGA